MIYLSYHNIDLAYAFQLSTLLIRYYRNVWLDRFEIDLTEDWRAKILEARSRATGVIVVVSDDYLQSPYCRAEFETLQQRGIPVTAVIPRDFSTELIADFTFSDWIDFRRWFDDPSDLSVENLLSQVPQSEAVAKTGERLDYLRGFIHASVLSLSKMSTSWASLRNADADGAAAMRPRMIQPSMLTDWNFTSGKNGHSIPIENLLAWSQEEPQFVIRGETGSGKSYFARLLALQQAQAAIRNENEPAPIWLDLARWDGSHRNLSAFIESQWTLLTYWRHWLDQHQTFIVLDNWRDFALSHPTQIAELTNWIDSSPGHRFVILSGLNATMLPELPAIQISGISAQRAQSFASGWLTLDQQTSFRGILKRKSACIDNCHLDHLSIGVELLTADRALAFNQWHENPMPALIALRSQQAPAATGGLDNERLLAGLQQLAWSMMLQDNHRYLARDAALSQSIDPRIIDRALDLGLMEEGGKHLRFHCEIFQLHLAAEGLKRDGLNKYLTRPEFSAEGERVPRKWDKLTLLLVDGLAEESRLKVMDQIAEVDPFVAAACLTRHPELSDRFQEALITKLAQLCAQNPAARGAFRGAIVDLPNADQTAELLIAQLSQFNNAQQLWLWQEIRALPLELPLDFIQLVSEIDRAAPAALSQQLTPFGLSRSLAYLVKLTANQDQLMRRNAIWLLGEIKYLPTAILLLSYLEEGEGSDHDEVVLALMKYAYSDLLVRVLRWSQDHPQHRPAVIRALAERKRLVTSRLLALADARRLTLQPEFYDMVVNSAEEDIAIGLAQLAEDSVDLPEALQTAIHSKRNAAELRARLAASIKHWPSRQGIEQLVPIISRVLSDPPESTIVAGSNIEALLYGQTLFDDMKAQAEARTGESLPNTVLAQLRRHDSEGRRGALYSLADYPADLALPLLLEAAQDEDKRVRLAAYEVLSRFENAEAAQKAVLAALADSDSAIVEAVMELLKAMPSLDCSALVDLLDSENPNAVAAAIDLLGYARHRPAAGSLRELLSDERVPAYRATTIGQLARQALSAIDLALMDGAQGANAPGRTSGMAGGPDALEFTDEEKIIRTLTVLRDDDWGRTQKAAKFLRKFARHLRGSDNPAILELLGGALKDDNWSVRWASAEALAMLKDQAAIPPLGACLDDPSWIVQVAAIRALVELGAAGFTAKLAPLLLSSRKAVREATAEALGEMGDAGAVAALGETLRRDADEFVRFAALRSIHQLNPSGARPHLELALSDSSVHLRWFALQHLTSQMSETDLPILQQLLNDHDKPAWENETIHDLAILALQRIGTDESRALLDEASLAEKRTSP
ncbi:MAG: HEAT repeat domain-containing protein [Chloroflexi bacterium]|nr:HEAT repeat domain-containing protein [Chloroflexota bacterium]